MAICDATYGMLMEADTLFSSHFRCIRCFASLVCCSAAAVIIDVVKEGTDVCKMGNV